MPVFGVRRHVAAFKARTCPRTPKSQRDAWNYRRRFAISTTICAAKQRNSSNRSAVAMIWELSGARARATSAIPACDSHTHCRRERAWRSDVAAIPMITSTMPAVARQMSDCSVTSKWPPGGNAMARRADSENADSKEEQKVKRDPDAELEHIPSHSHVPDFPAGCSI